MTAFLLDTNVLIYALSDSAYRDPCMSLIRGVSERRANGIVSTAVLEEVWHLELGGRIAGLDGVTSDYYDAFAPLISITDIIFRRALELDAPALGSNDRIHAATCLESDIKTIVTADAAFDTVRELKRVDPLDQRAVARLLTR